MMVCSSFKLLSVLCVLTAVAMAVRRPYLLPCLCAASMGVATTVLCIFVLEETLGRQPGAAKQAGRRPVPYLFVPCQSPCQHAVACLPLRGHLTSSAAQ